MLLFLNQRYSTRKITIFDNWDNILRRYRYRSKLFGTCSSGNNCKCHKTWRRRIVYEVIFKWYFAQTLIRLLSFQYKFKNRLISLIEQNRSPMGTRSMILSSRPNDEDSHDGFTKWPFMSTHPWAEYPRGKWSLEVRNLK